MLAAARVTFAGAFAQNKTRSILSVPMLAIIKIICDRIRPLMALGHFLEG